ncbi:common plant regulatory factor 1 isoform X2 [Amborella trichopoda]|uniref:common plant regulatory factor 1 isoform X2 n=1 Tax=Amborella trichopoda TaxID=13333 RepID=UPI0009BE6AB5|nr:common plant regulatory factor 1 isoform X2 [Amborella trichopoda]|eukprot:XP_020525961.1 common plant regulatory factor 1 isoform X2 [Amborella trichopoda]
MGNNDTGTTTSKSDKASSPVQNFHLHWQEQSGPTYPDWATAFQAYYGPGVSLPPPYFGSTIPSGHTPHPYMWGPQPLMPPYGTPAYAAIYSHGGVYAHPAVPLGSHAHGHGVASTGMAIEAMPAGPMGLETQAKSSSSKDQGGLMKKLKGFQGVTGASGNRNRNGNANGNGNSGSLQGGMVCGTSQSGEDGIEGSSDGSDGNTAQEETRIGRKRIGGNMEGKSGKVDIQGYAVHSGGEGTASCSRPLEATAAGKPMANLSSSNMVEGMDFRKAKASAGLASPFPGSGGAIVPGGRDGASSEIWVCVPRSQESALTERGKDDRERKRERRKQSNRESARRSRMRKQKESEQLAIRVEELNAENIDLKSQLNHLLENSKKLQQENSMLMEKLKSARLEHAGDVVSDKSAESQVGRPSVGLENLLSRVNNSGTSSRNIGQRENESHETKLHQLLESKARADAVAAG